MINLDELRRLSRQASGGRWQAYGDAGSFDAGIRTDDGQRVCGGDKYEGHFSGANAQFVAAANPKTVLAMADEIDKLRAELAKRESELAVHAQTTARPAKTSPLAKRLAPHAERISGALQRVADQLPRLSYPRPLIPARAARAVRALRLRLGI